MINIPQPLELNPIFHSEISSSYMLYEFLRNDNSCIQFLDYLSVNNLIKGEFSSFQSEIVREKPYKNKGSVDIYVLLKSENSQNNKIILIEVKVHDYLSATQNQINTYMEAALEVEPYKDITLIYITQFNEKFIKGIEEKVITPNTVKVFNVAIRDYPDRIFHITWQDFYDYLDANKDKYSVSDTMGLIIELQRNWMVSKIKEDINNNKVEADKQRTFSYYFPQTDDRISELEVYGDTQKNSSATVLHINLPDRNKDELDHIIEIIRYYAGCDDVDQLARYNTPIETRKAIKSFFAEVAQKEDNWRLLTFYSELFAFFHGSPFLYLQGTGTKGFSIKLKVKSYGEISICTIWRNLTIDFRLLR